MSSGVMDVSSSLRATVSSVWALVAGIVHFVSLSTGFEDWNLGALIGMPEYMNGIWYVSLLTVGVAFLAGKGGFFFIVGGYVCWWLLAPVLNATGLFPDPATLAAEGTSITGYLRLTLFRPVGIGMLIGGAVMGIVLAFPLVVSAIRSMRDAAKSRTEMAGEELPIQMLYVGVAGAFIVLNTFLMSIGERRRIDGEPRAPASRSSPRRPPMRQSATLRRGTTIF